MLDHLPLPVSRRQALRGGGALVVCFALLGTSSCAQNNSVAATTPSSTKPPLTPPELDSWIAVQQNGNVIGYCGKVDVGLGIQVAMAQIIADELDVDFNAVSLIMGDTATTINQGGASGSTGLELGGLSIRNAAAQARFALLGLASAKLNIPTDQLSVTNGIISPIGRTTPAISYGELIGGRYFDVSLNWNHKTGNELLVTGTAPLKNHADYKIVGQSIPRADIANKIFGQEIFNTDVRIPGMLHGRMVRPPVAGAQLLRVHPASIKHLPGVQIVQKANLLGVVAPKEWAAVRAARELKVTWSTPPAAFPQPANLYHQMQAATPTGKGGTKPVGNNKQAMAGAAKTIHATYYWPFQSHAGMGPACTIVDAQADHATIWTGDQKPHYLRDGVAKLLNLPSEKVHAIWLRGPGSYGRNDGGDCAMDAAFLSKSVGQPVRLQYMRADAIAWDPKGPASLHQVSGSLDENNKVIAYHYASTGFSRENVASHPDDPSQSLVGQFTGMESSSKSLFDVPLENYEFPNSHLTWQVAPALLARASPLRTSHLRDPLGPQINFASECFMDELAAHAQMDPIAFRLEYLHDDTGRAVIQAVAKASNWQPRSGPVARQHGTLLQGRGMSFARRKNTRVAVVVDVEVNTATGRVWPRHWFVAHDCGLIVNPATLKHVIEGNIVHASSRALFEEVHFSPHMVTSVDWLTYPILSSVDAPQSINITLLNHNNELPLGAGEPSSRPVASAIGNAIYHATGVRIREAPFTKARIKAALA